MIEPGRTFDGFDEQGHLYIVLSLPTSDGQVAVVNLRSHYPIRRFHSDQCLVVKPDEHQWVRRDSCANFELARSVSASSLERGLEDGSIRRHPRCSPPLLRRIQVAALDFPGVAAPMKAAIRDAMSPDGGSR